MRKQWDPRSRREALFQIHSILRSADNLRPDEAFDELVKLYEFWINHRLLDQAQVAESADLLLSNAALSAALPRLETLLSDSGQVVAADLFQELADVGVRSGLGQYFTPAPAARAIVAYLRPKQGEHWMDPFCGSGLLLGEVALSAKKVSLHGTDLDARVLRLAALEARLRHPETTMKLVLTSALADRDAVLAAVNAPADGVHGIVTNPPFGALDLQGEGRAGDFELSSAGSNAVEVLGLEQSLRLLRPGGRLGIVLPQSVLSNKRSEIVRLHVQRVAEIDGVLSLPAETFGLFKGVGKASVLFATKRRGRTRTVRPVWFGLSRSIGWDDTGRPVTAEDVVATAVAMREQSASSGVVEPRTDPDIVRNLTVEWNLRRQVAGARLGDLTEVIFTGKTPPRRDYCAPDPSDPSVVRVLKVGNLTSAGIDWSVGQRSFARFSRPQLDRLLEVGDVVLTAAAHHPRYIGAKVDIVDQLLDDAPQCVSSGEVMVIRCKPNFDPRTLVLWLRTEEGREAIQACITGQTAHLHPEYVADVVVPADVLGADTSAANDLLTESLRRRRAFETARDDASAAFAAAIGPGVTKSAKAA